VEYTAGRFTLLNTPRFAPQATLRRTGNENLQTKLSTCARKRRFASEDEALLAARASGVALRSYRCERCSRFHLTSRTKGKRIPRLPEETRP
jgi:hypothetical protein